jgi:hypothetical protein
MNDFSPFEDEAASLSIGDLTIENRLDRVEMYGSLSITRDKTGLAQALILRDMAAAIVTTLQADKTLPDHVKLASGDQVGNPFAE